jgi:hypothetical protein
LGKARKYEECHRINNGVLEKLCSICGEWLPCTEEYFYTNKSSLQDGLFPECKKCTKERAKIWTSENHEKVLIAKRKDNAKPIRKKYHREVVYKRRAKNGYFKEYREKNIDIWDKYKHTDHEITKQEWEQCKKYFNYSCAYCGISEKESKEKYKNKLHKEHVIHKGENDLSNCIRYITIPALRYITTFIVVTGLIGVMQMFDVVMFISRGGPAGSTDVLMYRIFRDGVQSFNMGMAGASSLILGSITIILTIIYFKLIVGRED